MNNLNFPFRLIIKHVVLVFCSLVSTLVCAQNSKFWVYLKDKRDDIGQIYVSPKTLENRRLLGLELLQYTDMPVTSEYIKQLKQHAIMACQSKWLNAVSMLGTSEDIAQIMKIPFVDRVEFIRTPLMYAGKDAPPRIDDYAITQINGRVFKKRHLSGSGISIGIIDGGFLGADVNPELQQFFKKKKVKAVRDFVDDSRKDFYKGDEAAVGHHGANVCMLMVGKTMGIARNSELYLARTEDQKNESAVEEDYWIEALEWMDSLGVRVVNSSLGYSLDFDNQSENHKPEDMDGKTCPISKAAQIGAEQKGMTIVVSAGNEGRNKLWGTVTAPADARAVISVGATDKLFLKRDVSSFGPPGLPYLKPDLACYSMGGTSFSAPIITAMIACIIQKKPSLKNTEIAEILKKASNLYPFGNNFIGYGVPDAEKVLQLLSGYDSPSLSETVNASGSVFNLKTGDKAIVFHKNDKECVVNQEIISGENGLLTIKRLGDSSRTTLLLSNRTIEILWNGQATEN